MRRRGKSRAEAEAMVLQFVRGRNYLHVIDAVYPPGEPAPDPSAAAAPGSSRKRRRLSSLRSLMAKN
jgi:hypothetical protein